MSRKSLAPMSGLMDEEEEERRIVDYASRAGIPALPTKAAPAPVEPKRDATRAKSGKVWFEMPEYVTKELRRLAFEQNCTVRSLVLRALNDSNTVQIDADDLIPDRRARR